MGSSPQKICWFPKYLDEADRFPSVLLGCPPAPDIPVPDTPAMDPIPLAAPALVEWPPVPTPPGPEAAPETIQLPAPTPAPWTAAMLGVRGNSLARLWISAAWPEAVTAAATCAVVKT